MGGVVQFLKSRPGLGKLRNQQTRSQRVKGRPAYRHH